MDETNYIIDKLYAEAMGGEEEVQRRTREYADDILRLMGYEVRIENE